MRTPSSRPEPRCERAHAGDLGLRVVGAAADEAVRQPPAGDVDRRVGEQLALEHVAQPQPVRRGDEEGGEEVVDDARVPHQDDDRPRRDRVGALDVEAEREQPPRGAEEERRPERLQPVGALDQPRARRHRPGEEERDDRERLRGEIDPEEEREPRRHPGPPPDEPARGVDDDREHEQERQRRRRDDEGEKEERHRPQPAQDRRAARGHAPIRAYSADQCGSSGRSGGPSCARAVEKRAGIRLDPDARQVEPVGVPAGADGRVGGDEPVRVLEAGVLEQLELRRR